MKLYVLTALLFLSQTAVSEVVHMTDAVWSGCAKKSCYTLNVERGGVSEFMPKSFFAKNIHLTFFDKKNLKKPYFEMTADHGFWLEDENRWVLVKGNKGNEKHPKDYYFLSSSMKLTEAVPK